MSKYDIFYLCPIEELVKLCKLGMERERARIDKIQAKIDQAEKETLQALVNGRSTLIRDYLPRLIEDWQARNSEEDALIMPAEMGAQFSDPLCFGFARVLMIDTRQFDALEQETPSWFKEMYFFADLVGPFEKDGGTVMYADLAVQRSSLAKPGWGWYNGYAWKLDELEEMAAAGDTNCIVRADVAAGLQLDVTNLTKYHSLD